MSCDLTFAQALSIYHYYQLTTKYHILSTSPDNLSLLFFRSDPNLKNMFINFSNTIHMLIRITSFSLTKCNTLLSNSLLKNFKFTKIFN